MKQRSVDHAGVHQPVLGTVVEVQITARSRRVAQRCERIALAEIERLEDIFSVYRPHSELVALRNGDVRSEWSEELCAVLSRAAHWQTVGAGVFNPNSGLLSRRWQRAEHEQVVPAQDELAELAAAAAPTAYRVDGRRIDRLGDVSALNLNAFAKGWIVQRAADLVWDTGEVSRLMVNAGGDLVHRGDGSVRVGIEDPQRPYDNAEPLMVVDLSNAGLASSGRSRRGFRIGDEWFSHVIDPRTGWPVARVLAASVIAPDAATADVAATFASVRTPAETLACCEVEFGNGVGVCVVEASGTVHTNPTWQQRLVA